MKTLMILTTGLLLALPGMATKAQAAKILHVDQVVEAEGRTSDAPELTWKKTQKFKQREIPSGREEFRITWDPGPRGVPVGASILFEYQRALEDELRRMTRTIDLAANEVKQTRFIVSEDGAASRGRVAKWRVRIVHRGTLLAESTSPSWE